MARKILLADDSVTAQNMGRKILTDAGYEVLTVNNGSAALKKVAEHKPDLIVLDVYMPGYSGLEVCQRLKENRETARIPILLTVGKLEPFKPEEARRVKADAYVVKPFEASELLTALTRLEDKIVPQASDNQKPGRFAKAIAAFEGGEKFGDAESGWKDRLRFPTGEKKQEAESEPEVPAPSSHAFRDLARDEAQKGAAGQPEFERPLPAGLPADITPEEIAAITAAAAQLSGKVTPKSDPQVAAQGTEEKTNESAGGDVVPASTQESTPTVEVAAESTPAEVVQAAPPTSEAVTPEEPTPVTLASASTAEVAAESQPAPTDAVAVPEAQSQEAANQEAVAQLTSNEETKTSESSEPIVEAKAEQDAQASQGQSTADDKSVSAIPGDAEVIAALETLKANGNGEAHLSQSAAAPTDGIAPPSMVAVVAAMEMAGVARWIAEPIPADHVEASASLEGEMQKAFAAFAAADAARMSQPAAAAITGSYVVPFVAEAASAPAPEPEVAPAAVSETASTTEQGVEAPPSIETSATAAVEASSLPSADTSSSETSEVSSEPAEPEIDRKDSHAEALRAAAWANWHQIRDSIVGSTSAALAASDQTQPQQPEETASTPQTADASSHESETMAAAASAGSASSTAAEAGAIANIVDSVLAELRPKIVEEIARKLGNDKKNQK